MEKEENILGTEKIGKLIRKFSIPCIISLLVNSLYNIVDQIFIGWGVGYLGNGATNVVFPLIMIGLAFSLMFGDGASAYLSLKLGEKKKDEAAKGVGNALSIATIVSVIIAYEFSTYLGGSGYMSCFIVGLITGNKQNFKMWLSQKHYDADCSVAETLGTICRMCIFIILGSQVQLDILIKYFIPSLISVLGLIFIVRPICVLLCTLVDRNAKWNKKELLFMMWVRETGVIPAALCGIVTTMKVPGSEIISSVVFMTISITLILQGSTTKLLARKLGLLEVENIEVSQVENIK